MLQYLVSASICLSIAYLAFRMLFDRSANFRQQRFFLILALAVSMVMPVAGFRIDLGGFFEKPPVSMEVPGFIDPGRMNRVIPVAGHLGFSAYAGTIAWIYFSTALAFILAIVIHIIKIYRIYRLSHKSVLDKKIILSSPKVDNPFSFFHWIFVPSDICDTEERRSIITHESIHVSQYHSIDNLLVELLAAAMWFNPLVWMIKRSFHLVHEYLADEGTLSSGVDMIRYQAFLLNRVAEESLICLPSGFNQSLIKKRMIMMKKSKTGRRNSFRILALIPLSAVLLLIVSILNGLFPRKAEAKSSELKQPFILDSPAVKGSWDQDDTLKKKTYKIKVITQEQSADKSKRIKVISGPEVKDTVVYRVSTSPVSDGSDTVVYIVDGKRQTDVSHLNPDSIESINVIKHKNQVIVTLKHTGKVGQETEVENEPVEVESADVVVEPVEGGDVVIVAGKSEKGENKIAVEPVESEHDIIVVGKSMKNDNGQIEIESGKVSFPEDVVYYIDGRKSTKAEVDKISPDNIESVSVFKGAGVKNAGVKEKEVGVVKIVTKKP